MFSKATFTMDSLGNEEFKGWSAGDKWNGWAVPLFMFTEAQRILDELMIRTPGAYNWYNRAEDSFYYFSPDDMEEAEKYQGTIVSIDGQNHKVYPIGSYAWTWEEVEPVNG